MPPPRALVALDRPVVPDDSAAAPKPWTFSEPMDDPRWTPEKPSLLDAESEKLLPDPIVELPVDVPVEDEVLSVPVVVLPEEN